MPWHDTTKIWQALLELGALPCGLGARDTLRLEACLPLHGHELGESITTLESGLAWITKLEKGEFIGRSLLQQQRAQGIPKALVGFFVLDAGIARHADQVFDQAGNEVGVVTSGTKTPTLNRALGMAIVKRELSALGTEVSLAVRGKLLKAEIVKRPFYQRGT